MMNAGPSSSSSHQEKPFPNSPTSSTYTSKTSHAQNKASAAVANSLKFAARSCKNTINFAKVQNDYRWEQLQNIEKRRRAILLHVEEPWWKVLVHWEGTVLRMLSCDFLFWLTLGLYVFVRVLAYYELPDYLDAVPSDSITVLGGFLSFFLVFWVNQSHKRFFVLYHASMGCKGRIFDAATLAVTTLPYAQATRLVRYMNAAHASGYVGLSTIYPSGNYFNHINQTMGLLTDQERARLDAIDLDKGGSCNRELIVWCMNEIATARRKGLLDPELANEFRQQILKLRAQMGKLYDAQDLPIPFFYVHFICLLTTLYLPLFAITAAINAGTGENIHWINGVIRGLVVTLQAIFVIGLRILGQKMNDPYGDDLIDLSVMFYVHFTWTMSNRVLNAHFPEEAEAAVEDALQQQRTEPLGAAWERPKTKPEPATGSSGGGPSVNTGDPEKTQTETVLEDVDMESKPSNAAESRVILNPAMD